MHEHSDSCSHLTIFQHFIYDELWDRRLELQVYRDGIQDEINRLNELLKFVDKNISNHNQAIDRLLSA